MPPRKKRKTSIKSRLFRLFLKVTAVLILCSLPVLLWLNIQVHDKFAANKWSIPAKVYARPLELFEGKYITTAAVEQELKALGYKKSNKRLPGNYAPIKNGLNIHTRGFHFGDGNEKAKSVAIRWRNNNISKLSRTTLLRIEPLLIGGIYPGHNEDRLLIDLADTPKGMVECLIAVEDRSFRSHFGISPRGIARAMWTNIKAGSMRQGGSTITQQLVKNLYLSQEKKLSRKLTEAPMAMLLEANFSKEKILETFMNEVFLAQDGQRAIHGFGLASQYFFNQPLNELKPHQYALLIGMIKGPSYYNPLKNPANATRRRNVVLSVMASQGLMAKREADFAKTLPLGVQKRSKRQTRQPAYLDLVRRQLAQDYDLETLESQGLRIFTSFDPLVQSAAEESISHAFTQIDKRFGKKAKGMEAAMLVTDSNTGDVVAVVGGRKARFAGFNRALDARRPIGSLAKPAVYLTALEQPDDYTLATHIDDIAFEWEQPDGDVWSPNNFDKKSHGSVSMLTALSKSYNQATARLGMDLGIDKVSNTLQKLGVTRDIPQLPSIFLGALELSTFDVASMYQTMASGGFKTPLRAIREVVDANGHPLKHYDLTVEQVFDNDSMHVLQYGLQSVMRAGSGRSAYWVLPKSLATAGKTGTSNEQRDSWFAGFAGDYLAVAWMGQDNNGPTPLTGSSGALQAWTQLFSRISRVPLDFSRPDSVNYAWTDMQSGLKGDEKCSNSQYLPYIAGTEPLNASDCARSKKRRRSWFDILFN